MNRLLDVKNLQTHFFTRDGVAKAVDGVSFSLERGQILGLVGESGSGKSVTGFSILGLVDPPGRVTGGRSCSTATTWSPEESRCCASCAASASR